PDGARFRLERAEARRRHYALARRGAPLWPAHAVRPRPRGRRLRGLVLAVRLDDAGDRRTDPRDSIGAMDREPGRRPLAAPRRPPGRARGDEPAGRTDARKRARRTICE